MRSEQSLVERFKTGVCRRSFSSPEALSYELAIAPALCQIVAPLIAVHACEPPVLDVGSGGGRITAAIADVVSGPAVAIDSSLSQVRRVARRARHSGRVVPVQASAEQLPLRDGRFGAVVSSCAVKHWPDPRAGLAECVRVARPGAPVVIVEIDGDASISDVRAFAHRTRVPLGLREAYVRFAMRTVVAVAPRREQLLALVSRAGIATPKVDHVDGFPFVVTHGYAP